MPSITTYFCGEYDVAHLDRNERLVEQAAKRRKLDLAAAPPVPPPSAGKRTLSTRDADGGREHGRPSQRPRVHPPVGRELGASSAAVGGLAAEAARHQSARRRDRAALLAQLSSGS